MGKKIFTLNEQVTLNKNGIVFAPHLKGQIGIVINVDNEEEEYYSVQFPNEKGDFRADELDFYTAKGSDRFDYENVALNVAKLVAEKQNAYGNSVDASYDVIKAFLYRYRTEDGAYKINEPLLRHLLLMVRIIDKQNRIFNNPEGDLMGESPYTDLLGYSLLGMKMMEHDKKR